MKLNDIYNKYKPLFSEKNIPEIALRTLLSHIFNFENIAEFEFNREKDFELKKKDIKLLNDVLSGIPVQYVINESYFYNMVFYVNKHVLIPRPETEELVFESLKKINEKFISSGDKLVIADVGCGSGNISLSIDKNLSLPHKVIGIDNSILALYVSWKNNVKLKGKCKFLYGNLLDPLKWRNVKLDVIVSNPPYVSKLDEIDDNVKKYEPMSAIVANPSYKHYKDMLLNYKILLKSKFLICFEIGYDQKETLENILKNDFFYRNFCEKICHHPKFLQR